MIDEHTLEMAVRVVESFNNRLAVGNNGELNYMDLEEFERMAFDNALKVVTRHFKAAWAH